MLKELLASAIILPFVTRRRVANPQAADTDRSADVIDVTPIRATDPIPAKWPDMTALEAAKVFFLEMQQYVAGEPVQLRLVKQSYDTLALERGWPALSDKALSQHLVSFGCKRKVKDQRRMGGGRPTFIEWPLETTAQKRRKRERKK